MIISTDIEKKKGWTKSFMIKKNTVNKLAIEGNFLSMIINPYL